MLTEIVRVMVKEVLFLKGKKVYTSLNLGRTSGSTAHIIPEDLICVTILNSYNLLDLPFRDKL